MRLNLFLWTKSYDNFAITFSFFVNTIVQFNVFSCPFIPLKYTGDPFFDVESTPH